jgi:hypothetical protein
MLAMRSSQYLGEVSMHTTRNRRGARPAAKKAKAAPLASTPPFLLRQAEPALPAFPADIRVPLHRGAVSYSIDHIYSAATATAIAQPGPPAKSDKSAKPKKPAAKRTRPAKRTAAKRKPEAATQRAVPMPAIPLPQAPEPTAELDAIFPPRQPLPRHRAPVPYGSGGLLGQLTSWLRDRSRRAALLLFPPAAPPKRKVRARERTKLPPDEVTRLRAENERLRRQLEALLALQAAAEPKVPAS